MQNESSPNNNSPGNANSSYVNYITGEIVDAAIKIHIELGPGLLEGVYEAILARTLMNRGLHVERQKVIRLEYQEMTFEEGFRVDLLVEKQVVVELKSLEKLAPGILNKF